MVNVFPTLLSFSAFAPLLLRASLGITLIVFALQMMKSKRIGMTAYFEANGYPVAAVLPFLLGLISFLSGLFLIFGFFTQVAALTTFYVFLNMMYIERRDEKLFTFTQPAYLLLLIIATSLLFSGAGAWSLDLAV
ncbi:MAG: hypothetical protein RL150_566 [Candidatus Parcubacteria bacterium]|jgi:uncharacterized membrane protein YphA (DoxX/SURF4 family)